MKECVQVNCAAWAVRHTVMWGKKERKRGAREEWSGESERRERGAERANERGMDGRVDGKEKEKEREQRNALVRHAMLGWNQVRPT